MRRMRWIAWVLISVVTLAAVPSHALGQFVGGVNSKVIYQSTDGSFSVPYDPSWGIVYEAPGAVVFTMPDLGRVAIMLQQGGVEEVALGLYTALAQLDGQSVWPETMPRQDEAQTVAISRGILLTGAAMSEYALGAYGQAIIQLSADFSLIVFLWRPSQDILPDSDARLVGEMASSVSRHIPQQIASTPALKQVLLHTVVAQNGSIVFLSNRDHPNGPECEVYGIRVDGTREGRLTSSDEGWVDVTNILRVLSLGHALYVVEEKGLPCRVLNVFENTESFPGQVLLQAGAIMPAWSPDLSRIVYTPLSAGEHPTLFIMDNDGSGKRQISLPSETQADTFPAWSPDAEWIVFTREGDSPGIYKMRPDGSDLTRLVRGNVARPMWSPDGSQFLFQHYDRPQQHEFIEVWIANSDGTDTRPLAGNDLFTFAENATWSPDGRQIAFSGRVKAGDEFHIYVINVDGSNLRQLTTEAHNVCPVWFPDVVLWQPSTQSGSEASETSIVTEKDTGASHPTPEPFAAAIPGPLPVPSLPPGWRLFYDPDTQLAMGVDASWQSKGDEVGVPLFAKEDYPSLHLSVHHLPELVFKPSSDSPAIEFAIEYLPRQLKGLGHIAIPGNFDEVWEDGTYRTFYTHFFTTNDMNEVMFKGIAVGIPRGDGTFPALICITDGRDLTEEDMDMIRTVSSSVRFGDDAVVAAQSYALASTPNR